MQPVNPFIVSGRVMPEYFCDRQEESRRLIHTVTNGNNLVLISPRRMGKTGLIQYCFNKPEIASDYHTFFIDILQTSSLKEFTYLLGREIFNTLLPLNRKLLHNFIAALKSLTGKLGFDSLSGTPTFNIQLGDIAAPEYTLDEIFGYLASSDKPCIVAIDEFQQIAKYKEKNVEALLRALIQRTIATTFIFAGSERHILHRMFAESGRPFYNSASIMHLSSIPLELYCDFVVSLFRSRNKNIDTDNVERVYSLFEGHTYYMQKTFNNAFGNTVEGGRCTALTIDTAVEDMLASFDPVYRTILSGLSIPQKELFYAIAHEGNARGLTSAAFIKRNALQSASSVQAATKKLIEKDLITVEDGVYRVTDRLMAIWLKRL